MLKSYIFFKWKEFALLIPLIDFFLVFPQLPGGVDLTLSELQDMAARQQQQIENQQQVLVAKEQRLKYLKQQDQRQQHIVAEGDRLKKLRDRVESQEMKLKKLRALRGEVDKHRNTNGTLSKNGKK